MSDSHETATERPTVTLSWWAASGLNQREVELGKVKDVDLTPTSGGKNPFSVRIKGEVYPQHCRSIEWPENQPIPKRSDC